MIKSKKCHFSSLAASYLRQEARVVGGLGAQALGLGDVEQDVHDVGGDVQGQRELAPPLSSSSSHAVLLLHRDAQRMLERQGLKCIKKRALFWWKISKTPKLTTRHSAMRL